MKINSRLTEENLQLKDLLVDSRSQIAAERKQLLKSVHVIERLKRRNILIS
jgi:hypothetical protein